MVVIPPDSAAVGGGAVGGGSALEVVCCSLVKGRQTRESRAEREEVNRLSAVERLIMNMISVCVCVYVTLTTLQD